MSNLERVTYFNGNYVPENEAKVHFRDRSFKYGDGVFDMTRTFGHKIFKIEEHVERLYKSLNYMDIKIDISKNEMVDISKAVLEKNLHLLGPNEDYWVGQRISRGVDRVGGEQWDLDGGPTVIVECAPLPLKPRASLYETGIKVWTPSTRRTPFQSMSPRAKTHNYINLILGDNEVKRIDKDAWAILLDLNGNITEGMGSNIFTVVGETVYTPKSQHVLGGISRETVIEQAGKIGINVIEKDIEVYEAINSDEVFLTSTSLCICPVTFFNGKKVGNETYGPITKRLIESYKDLVSYDFVNQYLLQLD
ncbi:MAG: aminotransferase class IV [Chloroflexota bacterium]|nr:aminotransferase class IV [Chloroflexota bacterium]